MALKKNEVNQLEAVLKRAGEVEAMLFFFKEKA